MTNRIVIIHDLGHATAAMRAAAAYGRRVILRSAPNAASYLSAAVFNAIVEDGAQAVPGARFDAVYDCGAEPGFALNALRHGVKTVRVDAAGDVLRKISEIAEQLGASVEAYDGDGDGDGDVAPVLDLALEKDPDAACRDWFDRP
ncbi:MAG: hypothetical protein WD407_00325 [Rhodospirillales bacterium]